MGSHVFFENDWIPTDQLVNKFISERAELQQEVERLKKRLAGAWDQLDDAGNRLIFWNAHWRSLFREVHAFAQTMDNGPSNQLQGILNGNQTMALDYAAARAEERTEPIDGSFVRGFVFTEDATASYIWHRDDAEGHCDPRDNPQHWWSHGGHRWVSWASICHQARSTSLTLQLMMPLDMLPIGAMNEAINDA